MWRSYGKSRYNSHFEPNDEDCSNSVRVCLNLKCKHFSPKLFGFGCFFPGYLADKIQQMTI